MRPTLALLLAFAAAPAVAKDLLLSIPVACGEGESVACIIQQYPDADPTDGARDFTCGTLSYDGHKGTDFRLATLAQMEAGVTVLAAAPGTVTGTRDGMADIYASDADPETLQGRDCGNGLVINHGGGWETQYCHLKQGSLAVAKGDRVAKGTNLGQIGLSGRTDFPHLHISVRKNGEVVDPFNPDDLNSCGPVGDTLWEDPIAYQAGGILDIGLHTSVPEFDQIKTGLKDEATLPADSQALVLWGYFFGSQTGDVVKLDIQGPDGWRFDSENLLKRPQAQLFRAGGRKKPENGWPAGQYEGTVQLVRGGEVLDEARISTRIDG